MSERPYITCMQLIEFIGDYLDDSLDEIARSDFERHLTQCSSCRAYLQTYRDTTRLAKLMTSDEALDDVPEDLVRTILSVRRS